MRMGIIAASSMGSQMADIDSSLGIGIDIQTAFTSCVLQGFQMYDNIGLFV